MTATRQFDSCKLLFIVLLERRSKLRYEGGAFDRKGFDIYCDKFRIEGPALEEGLVPAITSASLRLVSNCLID